jgi:hypothetical protein
MATAVLVNDDIEKGREVVKALDAEGVGVTSAFWIRDAETENFRLVLAMPKADADGPLATYKVVREALERRRVDFRIWHLDVVPTTDETTTLLRRAVPTSAGTIGGIRFSHNVVDNKLVEDAYVYRSS